MLAITLTSPPQWSPFSDEGVSIPHRLHKVVRGEVGAHRPLLSAALAARIDARGGVTLRPSRVQRATRNLSPRCRDRRSTAYQGSR